ncbi:CBF/Mak21 family-domain-containing protein [Apiosordaria backusii]|uniref:CBF/Mak21 family-domain-containing protein n=1 Tax=Apiosordaria backusii TaxID=314023 RepID=A0AA40B860_9PEZI|nr:CBF/Mak21 family-domain-containing protein [Apiosordaria backusii]
MGIKRTKDKKRAGKPTFDEVALAQLTSKIDQSLGGSENREATKRKRPRDSDDAPNSKRRQTKPHEQPKQGARTDKHAVLLDEILALGGDKEDLELVANLESDNEEGDAPKPKPVATDASLDDALRHELAKFASSLGFQKLRAEEEDPDTDESEPEDEDVDSGGAELDIEDEGGQDEEEQEEETEDGEEEEEPVIKNMKEVADVPQETRQSKKSGKLIFEPRPDWHGLSMDGLPSTVSENAKPNLASIANLKAYAQALLDGDSVVFSKKQSSSSTQRFMSTIMSSGTLSDKVSALTLSIQESPLHTCKAFENLIALAGKKSRGQAIAALGALVDLLGNGSVLPNDRRLRVFSAQPALLCALQAQGSSPWTQSSKLPGKLTQPHLMMWAYEDWLKDAYFRIIQLLEAWCSDEIEYSRSRALDFVFGLLKSKPEQEANLLRLLVNKLGDRERKIASRASYLILQLLNLHPGMKAVVIKTVELEVLLKPGQSMRTRYYAVNTLNQTILSTKEPAIADSLLRIYFESFLSLLKTGSLGDMGGLDGDKKAESNPKKNQKRKGHNIVVPGDEQETAQKLVSSLLTGVNRAIPFAAADDSTLEKHLDTLFRITHSSNFNTSVQALMLIQQLASSKLLAVDRFYRTLYESLLDPRLVTSSKQALYLNLLYRAMMNDVDVRRVKAFVKRLVQVLSLHQAPFACGILFLIAELQSTFPDLHTLLDEPEDNEDDEEEVYKDVREDEPQALTAAQDGEATKLRRKGAYDGRKRDPEHSNAHRSCLWELVPFLSHYHPSVGVFAANLLSRQNKKLPKPDLANHTLMHFLDKFVYRNPKAEDSKRGGSIMQPVLASGSASHIVASNKAGAKQSKTVNSASFWNLKPEQVSAEDVFFHEYFSRIGKPVEGAKTKKEANVAADSDDEEAEDEIWEALVNSRPEVEGDDADEDSDIDMEGYEDSDEDMDVDAAIDEDMEDLGSEVSEDDGGFEGIFGDSEESDEDGESAEEKGQGQKEEAPKKFSEARRRRKELKALPTFASIDDYAEMLAGEEDGLEA